MATGQETVVIGGFRESDNSAASNSAQPDPEQFRVLDAQAASETSSAVRTIRAGATHSGSSFIAVTGTSVAAATAGSIIARTPVLANGRAEVSRLSKSPSKPIAAAERITQPTLKPA